MSVTSQCVYVPFGGSGSSTRTAMLLVPAGTFDHASGGDTSGPSQVNSLGIAAPSGNAYDTTSSFAGDFAFAVVANAMIHNSWRMTNLAVRSECVDPRW